MKDKSVTVNGVSFNGEQAKALGREEWVNEVADGNFDGDKTKAGEAYDSIMKELEAREKQEQEEKDEEAKREESRKKAEEKMAERASRGTNTNSKQASKPKAGEIDSSVPRNAGAVTTKSIEGKS